MRGIFSKGAHGQKGRLGLEAPIHSSYGTLKHSVYFDCASREWHLDDLHFSSPYHSTDGICSVRSLQLILHVRGRQMVRLKPR